ncbi:anaerobic ribonucleoside-triphosphate reductase activating protein [Pseudodesulfovibrio piezophilus]|uniref:Anaerobic ribonucleoside-triphosphate reductase activating protein n=1 Tax=Pseudodesulfovibrio piezophilus (strain DSM 21447 / JCM 15486 / C1TLV30) TaxID=1322246 RepID=M1WY11_PSEP2|nr:anaerobic ribonucleoside-triphosphate reductase activating protein [Pseudodesulfovibrio piezophilus]CCH50053.1 Anaerobic ribonucleoside-triphosphate reductase activating protein [Pseudodesulfovibrio piezophilus C1TLV30]
MNEPAGVWEYVRGFENLSLCDWPGRATCIIFLGGCNLRCPTCHNHQLAWDMQSLPVIDHAHIKSYLRDRAGWLDGVTVTGGEPTQIHGVGELLYEIKRFGLPVKVDTNGMRPDIVKDLLHCKLADVFAVDVKGPYGKYPALTGQAVSEIAARHNLERIFEMAASLPDAFYFRTTRVPGLTDGDMEIAQSYLPPEFELKIQQYVPPRRTPEHAQPDNETRRQIGDVVI